MACLCLSLGKLQTAKKLYSAAIDYLRTTKAEESRGLELMSLLRGFASCCMKTGDLNLGQEALKSALAIAESVFRQMSDEAVETASQLRTINELIARDLDHRKRALVASTGGKLNQEERDIAGSSNVTAASFRLPVPLLLRVQSPPPGAKSPQCASQRGQQAARYASIRSGLKQQHRMPAVVL